jgi:hypothetical protein
MTGARDGEAIGGADVDRAVELVELRDVRGVDRLRARRLTTAGEQDPAVGQRGGGEVDDAGGGPRRQATRPAPGARRQ